MPYFNLMSAINLYVAVDWQGDKEIERTGREEGWREEGEDDQGRRETRGGRRRGKPGKERNPELRQTEREEREEKSNTSGREERKGIHKRDRYPVFINRNSIWTKQARQFWGNQIIPVLSEAHGISVYIYIRRVLSAHQATDLQRTRERSRYLANNQNSGKLHSTHLYVSTIKTAPFSKFITSRGTRYLSRIINDNSYVNTRFIKTMVDVTRYDNFQHKIQVQLPSAACQITYNHIWRIFYRKRGQR